MFVKLLVLGRPGSGKTTASNHIKKRAEVNGWFVNRSKDYNLLHDMFVHDVEQKRFRPTDHGGFEIVDFSVLDEALSYFKEQKEVPKAKDTMLVIEFARDNYERAFEILGSDFLRDANILFVDADVDTCIERIHQRIYPDLCPDKHFVADFVLKGYYGKDNSAYMKYLADMSTSAKEGHTNMGGVVQYINNIGSLVHFYRRIDHFFDDVMTRCIHSVHFDNVSIS